MDKYFSRKFFGILILITIITSRIKAQDTVIGIGQLTDYKTKLPKSFALKEIINENPININKKPILPIITDFPYSTSYGIDGIFFDANVKLNFYKSGKKIGEIKTDNDWYSIYNEITSFIEKDGPLELPKKFKTIDEGKPEKLYAKKISENLPGTLEIKIPETDRIIFKALKVNLKPYKSKNTDKEIRELLGKFKEVDVKEIAMFNSPDIPENIKEAIKPMVFPLSNTLIFNIKMMAYGGVFLDKNESNSALNCFFNVVNSSKTILASPKEMASLKAMAFKNITDIYKKMPERKEMEKLYQLAFDLNNEYTFSDEAQTIHQEYYEAIDKVKKMCVSIEANLASIKSSKTLKVFSIIANDFAATSYQNNWKAIDQNSLNNLNRVFDQGIQNGEASYNYINKLAENNELVDSKSFITEGVKMSTENNHVAYELLDRLIYSPNTCKNAILKYSADKPKLNSLAKTFYNSKEIDKSPLIKALYEHFIKIEMVLMGLETRNRKIEDKIRLKF